MLHLIKKSNKSSGENLLIEKRIKKLEKSVEQLDIDVSKLKVNLLENNKNNNIVDSNKNPTISESPEISEPNLDNGHINTSNPSSGTIDKGDIPIDDSSIDGLGDI